MGYHSVRLRRGSVLAFAVLLVAAVVGTVVLTSQQPVALPAWSLFNKGIPGGEENQRIEFLQKYGWEAEVPPISEEEIVIPAEPSVDAGENTASAEESTEEKGETE